MSESSARGCKCGNISVAGPVLPSGVYPRIPPSERTRLFACSSLFSVTPRSLEVRQPTQISVKTLSPVCIDVLCSSCRTTIRFFAGQGTIYAGQLPEARRREPGIQQPVASESGKLFPAFMRSVFSPNTGAAGRPVEVPQEVEDPDFDLMFSSRANPVVGSCRTQSNLSGEFEHGSGGSRELGPSSYY
jgi:hypothetical protein